MTAILLPSGRLRYHAYVSGVYGPAVGYKLYTYEAGTTTPKATYADSDAATPLANPIVLDANGECAPYGVGTYKLLLADPSGATVPGWPQDNVYLTGSAASEEWCGTAGGTANALALTPAVGVTAYQSGSRFSFVAASANTGAVTVNVSGVGTVALTKNGNTALAANDLQTGRLYQIQYDGVRFQLASDPRATLTVTAPDVTDSSDRVVTSGWVKSLTATDARAGIVELATNAEAQAGTDTARAITPAGLKAAQIQLSAAQATTSGTFKDFTGIPAWAKRITLALSGVSTSGGSLVMIQLGDSGGMEATDYTSQAVAIAASGATSASTNATGFIIDSGTDLNSYRYGHVVITKADGNTWVMSGNISSSTSRMEVSAGSKTLSDVLTQLRITTVGGTETFDVGVASISYE